MFFVFLIIDMTMPIQTPEKSLQLNVFDYLLKNTKHDFLDICKII